jgi:hypothetical protein
MTRMTLRCGGLWTYDMQGAVARGREEEAANSLFEQLPRAVDTDGRDHEEAYEDCHVAPHIGWIWYQGLGVESAIEWT